MAVADAGSITMQRGEQLRRGIARKRPFGRLAEQPDQHQAGQEIRPQGPNHLLDRKPDLVPHAGPLADIEVERCESSHRRRSRREGRASGVRAR